MGKHSIALFGTATFGCPRAHTKAAATASTLSTIKAGEDMYIGTATQGTTASWSA